MRLATQNPIGVLRLRCIVPVPMSGSAIRECFGSGADAFSDAKSYRGFAASLHRPCADERISNPRVFWPKGLALDFHALF